MEDKELYAGFDMEKQKEYEDKLKKITHKATLFERIENAIKSFGHDIKVF